MNDIAYQLMEERQVSFEIFCKTRYEEVFADRNDEEWEDYKEWVAEHYNELEEGWKNDN